MIQIDMEMPDSCRECWFLKYDMNSGETSCVIEDMILARYFKALDFEGRHEECPLVDVPDMNDGNCSEIPMDLIDRLTTIDAMENVDWYHQNQSMEMVHGANSDDQAWYKAEDVYEVLERMPSVQPELRYTVEELMVFQHGISLSLLSKRSSQHWRYDEDMATEIKFLERLYEKVGADMRTEKADYVVQPEQKKGKWLLTDTMYACDQCHSAFYETSPFCPMCGADMRGEQNE